VLACPFAGCEERLPYRGVGSGSPGAGMSIPLSCERCRTKTEFRNEVLIGIKVLRYSKGVRNQFLVGQAAKNAKGFVGLCGSEFDFLLTCPPQAFAIVVA
jgi:hypothetical protein